MMGGDSGTRRLMIQRRSHADVMRRFVFLTVLLTFSLSSYAWQRGSSCRFGGRFDKSISFRGGSATDTEEEEQEATDGENTQKEEGESIPLDEPASSEFSTTSVRTNVKAARKVRRTSELITDLMERSTIEKTKVESQDLRQLIMQRRDEFLQDLYDTSNDKLPDPRKLLHFLAPKIPAIKHSPDMALRIQSARSDMDPGIAASVISTLAHVWELFDRETSSVDNDQERLRRAPNTKSLDLVNDRRFEQLIECVLCGIDVKKRKKEHLRLQMDKDTGSEDIEELLDGEDVQIDEGLSIRDACRAAWGIAILGVNQVGSIGGEKVADILNALALQIRELLLARLQLLRVDDLYVEEMDGVQPTKTIEERVEQASEEIAEDAATAMWTFACVRACTGMRMVPLFDVCCSVLCQDPVDLRRRAQDSEVSPVLSVGTNDVVDRLAQSERDDKAAEEEQRAEAVDETEGLSAVDDKASQTSESFETLEAASVKSIGSTDALIDWLTANEVTDVLWALALHGRKDLSSSSHEMALSETAASFCEIAFDRLITWLKEDLETARREHETLEGELSAPETMTVEVVDASTLLASEDQTPTDSVPAKVEKMTIGNIEQDESVRQVQVVDAATLLASESDETVQDVQVVDAASLLASEADHDVDTDIHAQVGSTDYTKVDEPAQGSTVKGLGSESVATSHNFQRDLPLSEPEVHFKPHDLCSITWAVTEMQDSLRDLVTVTAMKIFVERRPHSFSSLSGTDLSNLMWATAKCSITDDGFLEAGDLPALVAEWVADNALEESGGHLDELERSADMLLQRFQPPELSRLLWAITSSLSGCNLDYLRTKSASDLSVVALVAAASNLPIFGTEDLSRIVFAFLELSHLENALSRPTVAEALGKVVATIETSLLLWENGKARTSKGEDVKESVRFTTFFGRTRFHIPLLDQKLDDDGEDLDDFSMPSLLEKSRLPLLRELPIDPSTLCKVACSFSRLSARRSNIRGSEKLAKVALRLLTSRDGRLLRECAVQDLIRLCEAAALAESSLGRELISLFARRVVRQLNRGSESDPGTNLSTAQPEELATLVWSLGELGVKHHANQNEPSPHRRLQLVVDSLFVPSDKLDSIRNSQLVKLFHGLVTMNVMSTNRQYFAHVLNMIKDRFASASEEFDLCELIEPLGTLRASVDNLVEETTAKAPSDITTGSTETADDEPVAIEEVSQNQTTTLPASELLIACDSLLSEITIRAVDRVENMTAVELRSILTTYASLPFQSDSLVLAIEDEVNKRIAGLESAAATASLRYLLREATADVANLKRTLMGDEDNYDRSPFAAIRNGLKSLFGNANDVEKFADEEELPVENEESQAEQLKLQLEKSLESISAACTRLENTETLCALSSDEMTRNLEQGTLFELGRCQELIRQYRRIDFESGTSDSRFDNERRRVMSKRVLSRLLP